MLILHGLADSVTSPELSEELYTKAPSEDKTLKLYEGMWHALTCEPGVPIVYGHIDTWIEKRSKGYKFMVSEKEIIPASQTDGAEILN